MNKAFRLSADDIQELAPGIGGCFATDAITVDGCGVGLMYREKPVNDEDSGWRFFSGDETEEQVSDPDYLGFYDVNVIANYDPSIVPFLEKPSGYAFQRNEEGEFEGGYDEEIDSES